ncbi:hypothetical protein EV192_106789 [Actinocrispum wychmicini]|uniref:Uncharacterized protein n=2 Tax=Actinocrispum wychmicini TaxID=1213861 RepID=A0A4R2JGA1_9PSEU|nr:hypothetical protein EV192_106789 [Actinocrispum wychmicini]
MWPAVVVLVTGWLVLAGLHYFQLRIATTTLFWIAAVYFGPLLSAVPWVVLVGATAIAGRLIWRRARWRGVAAFLVPSVVVGVVVALVNWQYVYKVSWYRLHRSDFAAVARLADDRTWTATAPQGYYGPKLPAEYQYLSTVDSLSRIGVNRGTPVWFLSQWAGIPDGAIGYAHITGDIDETAELDGFGDPVKPTVYLGDGWWWVE